MNIYNFYSQWVKNNTDRFTYRPYIDESESSDRSSLLIRFELIPHIVLRLDDEGQAMLYVEHKGEWRDTLIEFDVYPEVSEDGQYYCSMCLKPGTYEYPKPNERQCFETLQALWNDHVFEPLVVYVDEKFKSNHQIACWDTHWEDDDHHCFGKTLIIDVKDKYYWSQKINKNGNYLPLFLPVVSLPTANKNL